MAKLPIILREHSVVVITQMNLVSRRREPSCCSNRKESGIDRPVGDEVIYRGKELKVLDLRFETVNFRPQEVPAELEIVIAEEPGSIGG